ncbi:MAG TPA: hypothetical protein VMA30_06535 [Xanthobacteraceae bacterium]|nr:hypothetical protein [Xanthobacteraceae bacterium]
MDSLFHNPPLRIKIPAALLALILGIYPHILPDAVEPLARPIAGVLFIWLVVATAWHTANEWLSKNGKPPLRLDRAWVTALCGLLLAGIVGFLSRPPWPIDHTPPLLRRMQTDFPGMDATIGWWNVRFSENSSNTVTVIVYDDIRTMTKFVAFYVPDIAVFETCQHLAGRFGDLLKGPPTMTMNGKPIESRSFVVKRFQGDPDPQSSLSNKFTGAAYIYYEGALTDEQRVDLRKLFAAQGVTLMFRGQEFLKTEAK